MDPFKIQKGRMLLKFFRDYRHKYQERAAREQRVPSFKIDFRIQNCMLKYYEHKTRFQQEQAEQKDALMAEQLLQQKSKFNKIIFEYKKFIDEQLDEKEKIL